MNDKPVSSNLLNGDVWIRIIYMAAFVLALAVARLVVCVVTVLQAIVVLVNGSDNCNLRNFGQSTSKWVYQTLLFITFNSEEKPFPFSDWPEVEETDGYQAPEENFENIVSAETPVGDSIIIEGQAVELDDNDPVEVDLADDSVDDHEGDESSDKKAD